MKHKKTVVFIVSLALILSMRITADANVDEYGNDWFESSGAYELSEYLENKDVRVFCAKKDGNVLGVLCLLLCLLVEIL